MVARKGIMRIRQIGICRREYDMNLTYKRATLEDIDILTETRIEVLRAANKLSSSLSVPPQLPIGQAALFPCLNL